MTSLSDVFYLRSVAVHTKLHFLLLTDKTVQGESHLDATNTNLTSPFPHLPVNIQQLPTVCLCDQKDWHSAGTLINWTGEVLGDIVLLGLDVNANMTETEKTQYAPEISVHYDVKMSCSYLHFFWIKQHTFHNNFLSLVVDNYLIAKYTGGRLSRNLKVFAFQPILRGFGETGD